MGRQTQRSYRYRVNEHIVYITFYNFTGPVSKPHLLSAELYDNHRKFKGTWFRDEMPVDVRLEFERQIRMWEPPDPPNRK